MFNIEIIVSKHNDASALAMISWYLFESEDTVVVSGDLTISYKAIFQDVRDAIDYQYTTVNKINF
jgi:hypothetical protein